ncbi:hypothetical protein CKQ79_29545, partial [Klebsiella pneumoniae]
DEVKAAVGDKIEKGQPIVILEAMKMKMPVASPEAGVLKSLAVNDEVKAAVGDKIEKGQPIVILEAMKMKMPVASP